MRRPTSELFVGRAVLFGQAQPVGGFIALTGAELAHCRLQDALAAAAATPAGERSALARRLRSGRSLFPAVGAGDLHLSRMGVLPAARGRGYGRAILNAFLEEGRMRGFSRFTLDVSADNAAALALYRSAGFREQGRQRLYPAEMTYVRMALEMGT